MDMEKVNTPAPLTSEQLLAALKEQGNDNAKLIKALTDALIESRKPYIDPKVVANMEQARKDRKAIIDNEIRNRQSAKKNCPHLNEGGKLNIKWHQHSNGIILGVCGSCRSEFDATHNPKDAQLLMADPKSLRNMAQAGTHARRGLAI